MTTEYKQFLENKIAFDGGHGLDCDPSECHPSLKPHQRDIVAWAVRGGRRAIFSAFGLGKTRIQLEIIRLILQKTDGGRGLVILPLGVRQEFKRDAEALGLTVQFIRRIEEAEENGIYLTNYETVRDGKLDPRDFTVVTLDEAGVLRGFGGTKTFREFMAVLAGDRKTLDERVRGKGVQYRFVATATPSPNDYIELLAYAAFLDIMDVSGAKTRFFKRDSVHADRLTLHPHKEEEFWDWITSWAVFLQKPSDLGYSDEGYELPALDVRWHEIPTDHSRAITEKDGQARLFKSTAIGIQEAAREKRDSLGGRLQKMLELRAEDPMAHRVIWHDLEAERHEIEAAIPGVATVYGQQDLDSREEIILDFADGKIPELASKPVMLGSGCNFQYHCSWAIFLGIGFKFNDFIQAIHRIQRFLQTKPVRIDLIYTEAEREVRKVLEGKWKKHKELVEKMTGLIREHGLAHNALHGKNRNRAMGVERAEVDGQKFHLVYNDSVAELPRMETDSMGLILTSIPFSSQYEYSPNYADFGHSDNNEQFFKQMDFLTPDLLRVLQPGRLAIIHVKDRIVPGGMTGLGFQVVYPFHAKCIEHYTKHGFAYMGMKTIVTDVVRENNQTYRLGWTEQCKDGSKMGVGMPEYLLMFRKPPTGNENSYADNPIIKTKRKYSRSRWQIDAHGFGRSSGNRLISPSDFDGISHAEIFRKFRDHSLHEVYDYEQHVAIGESLDDRSALPVTFMLLQPQSWHPDVWTDIARMRTLNTLQSAKGRQMHLCPMQFDIADRIIEQFSMEGESVLDPFMGLGTVPMEAVKLGRRGVGIELCDQYFREAIYYCRMAEAETKVPSLFDLIDSPILGPSENEAAV